MTKLYQKIKQKIKESYVLYAILSNVKSHFLHFLNKAFGYYHTKKKFYKRIGYPLNLAHPQSLNEKLIWKSVQTLNIDKDYAFERLVFEDGVYDELETVPHFNNNYPIHSSNVNIQAMIRNLLTINVSQKESEILKTAGFSDTAFAVSAAVVVARKTPYANIDIVPLRWNPGILLSLSIFSFAPFWHLVPQIRNSPE